MEAGQPLKRQRSSAKDSASNNAPRTKKRRIFEGAVGSKRNISLLESLPDSHDPKAQKRRIFEDSVGSKRKRSIADRHKPTSKKRRTFQEVVGTKRKKISSHFLLESGPPIANKRLHISDLIAQPLVSKIVEECEDDDRQQIFQEQSTPISSTSSSTSRLHIGDITAPPLLCEIIEDYNRQSTSQDRATTSPSTSHSSSRPNQRGKPMIDTIQLLKALAYTGAIIVGYCPNITGGVLNIPFFLHLLFPKIYRRKEKGLRTNFCTYANVLLVFIMNIISFVGGGSMWLAFGFSNYKGRMPTLRSGLFLILLGGGFLAWFPNMTIEIFGNILVGTGLGLIHQVFPLILSEIAPKKAREQLGRIYISQVYGNTLAYIMQFIASLFPDWGWRLPFIALGIMTIILLLLSTFLDETPKYLMEHEQEAKAKNVLKRFRESESDAEIEFEALVQTTEDNKARRPLKDLLSKRNRPVLVIKIAEVLVPQLLGVAPLLSLGPLVATSLDIRERQVFYASMVAGIARVLVTLATPRLLHRFGRRWMLFSGSFIIMISQVIAWAVLFFDTDTDRDLKKKYGVILAIVLVLSSFGSQMLQSPYGWIKDDFLEVGDNLGSTILGSASMLLNAIMPQVAVHLLCLIRSWVFFSVSVLVMIFMCIVYFFIPETTQFGKTSMTEQVWEVHRFWKRYMQESWEVDEDKV